MGATVTAHLRDVAAFVRGVTFKPDDVVPVGADGSIACMRTKNIQCDLDLSDVWGVPSRLVKRDNQFLAVGDLLVSSANSWNLVGKCCWVPQLPWRATFGGFISALRADSAELNPRYLFHWFSSPRIQMAVRSFGRQTTNISNLDVHRCLELPIPLPSLPEQRRIAAILDKADALRANRRAAIAKLDQLTQSIFLDMFGDPAANSRQYLVANMGDVCDVRDGTHDSPKYVSSGGFPLVTSKNVTGGAVDLTNVNYISKADYHQINKRSKVDRGDIILPMIGTIGSPVLVDHEPTYAIKNVALIKFTAESPCSAYVLHLLSSPYFDQIVSRKNRGGTQKFVSLGDLRSFPIPLPSREEQAEFSRRIGAVKELQVREKASNGTFDKLFASLQHRAFRGELRPGFGKLLENARDFGR